jgi:hypothetical protein
MFRMVHCEEKFMATKLDITIARYGACYFGANYPFKLFEPRFLL